MTPSDDNPWCGAYKIPWHEEGFSRRMLAEHLSQDHDLASRKTEWIDRQVAWLHAEILRARSARILDLGCGPGLYSHRLAARGHRCLGIDFGPASIEYARTHSPDGARCEFAVADVRAGNYGGPFDLAMMLFGEFNVFSPDEAAAILREVRSSLAGDGTLLLERQSPEAVEAAGCAEPTEHECQSGLFSDGPYRCRTVSRWLPQHKAAVQTFAVTETETGRVREYRSTTRVWTDEELTAALSRAGFVGAAPRREWPCNTDALQLWSARA